MTLAKRLALERNQRRRKMLWMSKTDRSSSTGVGFLGLTSFLVGEGGGILAIEASSMMGESMRSTWEGEDMVVRSKRRSLGKDRDPQVDNPIGIPDHVVGIR